VARSISVHEAYTSNNASITGLLATTYTDTKSIHNYSI
jgi:hypothetical protein